MKILSVARGLLRSNPRLLQARSFHSSGDTRPPRRRSRHAANLSLRRPDPRTEWWVVDGEMHEIGETVPPRERFVLPRDNISSHRRKALREQFMRRTRLILKDSENESWCRRYMELYNELRENWERLYWDEGYAKKIGQDHNNYDSAEDDEEDFNPNKRVPQRSEHMKGDGNRQGDTWQNVNLIRDKFEYDREKRMQQTAFAPVTGGHSFGIDDSRNKPFDPQQYISGSDDE